MSAFVACRLMRVVRVLYVYTQWEENVEPSSLGHGSMIISMYILEYAFPNCTKIQIKNNIDKIKIKTQLEKFQKHFSRNENDNEIVYKYLFVFMKRYTDCTGCG